ncbi:uncharacterized protein KGF55_003423 [Candida pseudojiufengensis]|uniref:uncharacterized protein n=1 Tax=Candida pseudojiufengensis TaxID=497109 RepID=UPI00222432DB|nr:uncharacterized protein KGF55_003423 [Candida pseudojiufengensis]KAI5962347.1 hypothetical protein KGF55_003423 [Candida pseudojiufengensis]
MSQPLFLDVIDERLIERYSDPIEIDDQAEFDSIELDGIESEVEDNSSSLNETRSNMEEVINEPRSISSRILQNREEVIHRLDSDDVGRLSSDRDGNYNLEDEIRSDEDEILNDEQIVTNTTNDNTTTALDIEDTDEADEEAQLRELYTYRYTEQELLDRGYKHLFYLGFSNHGEDLNTGAYSNEEIKAIKEKVLNSKISNTLWLNLAAALSRNPESIKDCYRKKVRPALTVEEMTRIRRADDVRQPISIAETIEDLRVAITYCYNMNLSYPPHNLTQNYYYAAGSGSDPNSFYKVMAKQREVEKNATVKDALDFLKQTADSSEINLNSSSLSPSL